VEGAKITLVKQNCCQFCLTTANDLGNFDLDQPLRKFVDVHEAIDNSKKILCKGGHGSITKAVNMLKPFSMKPSFSGVIFQVKINFF